MTADGSGAGAVDVSAEQAWERLRAVVLDHNDRRREVCEALGMSFIRTKVLRRLVGRPMTQRDLAAALNSDAPYMTVVIDDLESRGLVRRTPHPSDRRAKLVELTRSGTAAAHRADAILADPPDALKALAPADRRTLWALLGQLLGPPAEQAPAPGHAASAARTPSSARRADPRGEVLGQRT